MSDTEKNFSVAELDAIGEVMNISLGSSATAVSNMLNHRVDISTPVVSVIQKEEFSLGDLKPAIAVEIKYVSGLKGSNILMLKRRDIKAIVDVLLGSETPEEEFEMDELTISAVCEVMNQMMGAASTALSDFLGYPVNISTPEPFSLDDWDDLDDFKKTHFDADCDVLVGVRFRLSIEDVLESEFLNVMPIDLAREMLASFGIVADDSGEIAVESAPAPAPEPQPAPAPEPQPAAQAQPAAPATSPPTAPAAPPATLREQTVIRTSPVPLVSFDAASQLGEEQAENLELILSVPLEVSVEIGRTTRLVEEILSFSKGSLVVLDKLAGDRVDIFVNGLCVAYGDVVVIDDNFGVRITEVVRQPDLLKMQNKQK